MEGEGQEKAQRSVQDDKKAKLLKDAIDSWVMKLTDGSGNNRLLYYKTLKVGTLNTKGAESSKLQKLQNGEKVLVSELFKPEKSNQRTLTKDALSSDSQYALLGLIQFFERESHTNVPVGHKERIEKSDPMKVATSGGRNLSELIEVLESEVAGRKLDDGLAEELKMLGINHLVDVDKHLKSVSNIYKRAKSYFEEKGVSILYVTKDFVTWEKDPTKKAVPNAPLLLAPLEITPVGSGQTDFYLKITDDWQINETLILHLEKKYGSVISLEQLEGINNGENLNLDQQSQKAFSLLEKTFGNQFQKKSSSIIGTFTYTKFPMVKDLENGLEWLLENDLVAAIAGDNESKEQVREENAPNEIGLHDPNHLPPKNEFLILDADSSQNFAINAALSGKSLVVHGPPGTGKSQTIANLISASVANRKSVLFVAEKRAAIEAVQKRLEQSGLGDVIFDLHLKKLKKSDHVSQLRNSSLRPKNQDTLFGHQEPQDYSETQQELERLRKKLIDYEHALHKVREPWGISRYEVGEQQLKFDSVESFRFKIPIHEIGDIKKVAESVHDWVEKSKVMSLESLWVRSAVNAKNRDSLLETVEKIEEVLHSQLLPLLKDLEKISTASNLKELPISQIMDLPNFSSDVEKIHEYFDPKIWNKALIARALKAEGTKELNGLMRRGIYLRLFAKRRKELLNEAGSLLDQWRKTYGMEAIPTEVFNHPKLIEIMNGLKSDISLLGKDVMETLNQSSVTRALNSAILMIDEKDITQSLLLISEK